MGASYVITRDSFHTRWLSRDRKPVLHIRSGDTVRFGVHDVKPPNWTVGPMIPNSIFGEHP
jgi:hypothetical protein